MTRTSPWIAAAIATLLPMPALAAEATAQVQDRDGNSLGAVSVSDTASGRVLVQIDLGDVPAGTHAIHLHETGDCSAADFTSAGGHIAGDASHGVRVAGGPHPGDMPNVTVASGGLLAIDVFLTDLDIEAQVLDGDGAAFVMHAGADDYQSQPAGAAGARIACGAFEPAE